MFTRLSCLAVIVALFALAACSDEDPTAAPTDTATPTQTPAALSTPTDAGSVGIPLWQFDRFSTGRDLVALLTAEEASCLENRLGASFQELLRSPLTEEAGELLAGDESGPSPGADCLTEEHATAAGISMLSIRAGGFSAATQACITELLREDSAIVEALGQPGGAEGGPATLRLIACLTPEEAASLTRPGDGPTLNPTDLACLIKELEGTSSGERIIAVLSGADASGAGLSMEESAMLGQAVKACGIETDFGFPDVPGNEGGSTSQGTMKDSGLPPDSLRPVDVGDPQVFLSGLAAGEQSCLGDNDIGPQDITQITGRAPGDSPETTAAIINCLQDETVLRLFLTTLVGQVEPFSQDTSGCIREGFIPLDLRGLLAPALAGNTPANSLAVGMAALNVSVACMNDDEWETYAPRLGMQPRDRVGAACLFEEMGGPAQLVEAMQAASLDETSEEFIRASEICGLESFPPPSATSTPEPTPSSAPAPSHSMQPHVFLRTVLVTEDWVPFSKLDGWTQAAPQKESATLRFYEAAIWEETDSVHLYAFPNDYDPYYGVFGDVAEDDVIAYREQYALSVHTGLPEELSDERSDFLRSAFEDFAQLLVERHPQAEHHFMFSGHGGPGGDLFAKQMTNSHADAFLASWTRLLGRPLGVIDMGGPCNKGGYEDLANFCKHALYYVASDLPNGGYSMDDWTPEKHWETSEAKHYHRILASNDTLEEALIERVDLRRKHYEYSRDNQTQDRWPQANYVYSCVAFRDFSAAFESFLDETAIPYPLYDLYELMLAYSAPPGLLQKFQNVIVHAADNRDFFEWSIPANGMISPMERIQR